MLVAVRSPSLAESRAFCDAKESGSAGTENSAGVPTVREAAGDGVLNAADISVFLSFENGPQGAKPRKGFWLGSNSGQALSQAIQILIYQSLIYIL